MANDKNFKVKQGLDVGHEANIANGLNLIGDLYLNGGNIVFEGSTEDEFELTLTVTDPTADRTITLPDGDGTFVLAVGDTTTTTQGDLNLDHTISATGTLSTTGDAHGLATTDSPTFAGLTINGDTIVLEGATANAFETQLNVVDPTQENLIDIPNNSGTLAVAVDNTTTTTQGDLNVTMGLSATGVVTASGDAHGLASTDSPAFAGLSINGPAINILELQTTGSTGPRVSFKNNSNQEIASILAISGTSTLSLRDGNDNSLFLGDTLVYNQGGGQGDNHTVWHSGNHGAGSGLDADTLDGIDSSGFVQTTGDQTIAGAKTFSDPTTNNRGFTIRKADTTLAGFVGLLGGDNGENGTLIMRDSSAVETLRLDAGTGSNYINGGNLGIGTETPSTKLQVESDSNTRILVKSTQTTGDNQQSTGILLTNRETSPSITESTADIFVTGPNTVTFGGPNRFILRGQFDVETAIYSNNTEAITIDTSQNVGIGETTPSEKLDVAGNIKIAGDLIFEGATDNAFETTITVADPTQDNTITFPNGSGTVAFTSGSDVLTISTTSGSTGLQTGDTLTISGGTYLTSSISGDSVTIDHDSTTRTNNTSTASPGYAGTFTAIDSVTTNATGHVTAVNTKTVTMPSAESYSFTVTADSGTNQAILSGNTLDIAGGTYLSSVVGATDTVTINHDSTTRSDTTSTESPAFGGTFTAVDSVTTNATGHVTAIDVKTVTLPTPSTDAETLDGLDSGSFLRSDANDTATGLITFENALGIRVSSPFAQGNPVINFNNFGGNVGSLQIFDDGTARLHSSVENRYIGITNTGTAAWWEGDTQYTLWHSGNDGTGSGLDADTLDGIQGSAYLRSNTSDTFTGTLTLSGNLLPNSTASNRNIGSATQVFNTVYATTFEGTATQAQYADLAEKYLADAEYPIGTVISIGGDAEVTATNIDTEHSVLGVVSEQPAYLMNKDLEGGTVIALKGRVPVKCIGSVKKGDRLAPSHFAGYATVDNSRTAWSFAIALEDGVDGLVEAVIL